MASSDLPRHSIGGLGLRHYCARQTSTWVLLVSQDTLLKHQTKKVLPMYQSQSSGNDQDVAMPGLIYYCLAALPTRNMLACVCRGFKRQRLWRTQMAKSEFYLAFFTYIRSNDNVSKGLGSQQPTINNLLANYKWQQFFMILPNQDKINWRMENFNCTIVRIWLKNTCTIYPYSTTSVIIV